MAADKGSLVKVLIGAGAALLMALMLLACFSLGVYVGHRGLLVGTVENFGARPAAGQQPPQPPTGPVEDLPPGRPALVGRVQAITNEGLFIQTEQGPRLVQVDDDAKVQDHRGQELSLKDLRQGVYVAIFGEFTGDGRRLVAETIVVVPPPQP